MEQPDDILVTWQRSWNGAPLINEKLELIDYAFQQFSIESFADLGCAWEVGGAYTFRTIEKFGISRAFMIDRHISDEMRERAATYPGLAAIQGNFADVATIFKVGLVDAVFLFDVLLHQVKPAWDEVLERWAPFARVFIIYNQQWIKSALTIRLLDLGRDEYLKSVTRPRPDAVAVYDHLFEHLNDPILPDGNLRYRDSPQYWQWGITDGDLITKMHELGFIMRHFKNCGSAFDTPRFENHAFIFTPKDSPA